MIDPQRFHESYSSLLASELTAQRRADLWDNAHKHFPTLSDHLLEEFRRAEEPDNKHIRERLTGASFMLLALANCLEESPIIGWEDVPVIPDLPAFGFLKPLS